VAVPRVRHHHLAEVADTVEADKTHRHLAIIENVHADLKHAALAHLRSRKFTANAAWVVLACIAFNLTRAAATIGGDKLTRAPPLGSMDGLGRAAPLATAPGCHHSVGLADVRTHTSKKSCRS
jgi:hypothetical protein